MRLHYVLNHGGTPESKLADVEIHFEEGLLAGLKLVGCSVWRSKKGEAPTVLVPSRSYATAGGIRYFELLRPSEEGAGPNDPAARIQIRKFKDYIKDEFQRIEALPAEPPKEEKRSKAAAG
jgi:hypothetical protein